jgi:hypothetical protein
MEAGPLIAQDFFNLTDFILDLAGRLLDGAFMFQIWIIDNLSGLFLDFSLHFVERALRLVFGTGFHAIFLLLDLKSLFCAEWTLGIRRLACHSRVASSPNTLR